MARKRGGLRTSVYQTRGSPSILMSKTRMNASITRREASSLAWCRAGSINRFRENSFQFLGIGNDFTRQTNIKDNSLCAVKHRYEQLAVDLKNRFVQASACGLLKRVLRAEDRNE